MLAPLSASDVGDRVQDKVAGTLGQVTATVPVNPLTGASVNVNVVDPPDELIVRVVGETLTEKSIPVPESFTDCGLPLALSEMLSEAPRVPAADGVNVIAIVQLPPAATEEPQVLFSVKSAGSAPMKAMVVMLKAALPVLFRLTT